MVKREAHVNLTVLCFYLTPKKFSLIFPPTFVFSMYAMYYLFMNSLFPKCFKHLRLENEGIILIKLSFMKTLLISNFRVFSLKILVKMCVLIPHRVAF